VPIERERLDRRPGNGHTAFVDGRLSRARHVLTEVS
jgi:hypothetical protein